MSLGALGNAYVKQGQFNNAQEFLEKAIKTLKRSFLKYPQAHTGLISGLLGQYGEACEKAENVLAWCVLPNHYHVLVETVHISKVVRKLGQLHGSTSYYWNKTEGKRGRKCWHRCADRAMRTELHKWVTLNYIHHNPVHHQYVDSWQDWLFSSAKSYLEIISPEIAEVRWLDEPREDHGK